MIFKASKSNFFILLAKFSNCMRSEPLNILRKQLTSLDQATLSRICIDLAKYRKENKEYLQYILFESANVESYVEDVTTFLQKDFESLSRSAAKRLKELRGIRKQLRKHIRFIKQPAAELSLLLWFCQMLLQYFDRQDLRRSATAIFTSSIVKAENIFNKLHEDIRLDYENTFTELQAEGRKTFL